MYSQIVIFGQKENGKSTLAMMLQQQLEFPPMALLDKYHSWQRSNFALPGKKFVADLMGVELDFLEEWKNRTECPPGWKKPVRHVLQEAISYWRSVNPRIWTDKAYMKNWTIFDDGRFADELEVGKDRKAFTIFLYDPRKYNTDPHESEKWCGYLVLMRAQMGAETFFKTQGFDAVVCNNGTLDQLNHVAKGISLQILKG